MNPTPATGRGFSYLELIVVVALIGVLLAVALPRLLPYVHEAERVGVATVEAELRDVLVVQAAKFIAGGESARVMNLNRANPMALVLEPPSTYLGELDSPLLSDKPPRSWFVDRETQALFYRGGPGLADPDRDDMPPFQAWVVDVAWSDHNADGSYSAAVDELHGVRLVRVAGLGHFRPGQTGR